MASTRDIIIYLIPLLEVAPECLGLEIEVVAGSQLCQLQLPMLERTLFPDGGSQEQQIVPPLAGCGVRDEEWDWRDPWVHLHRVTQDEQEVSYAVHRALLIAPRDNGDNPLSAINLGGEMDLWYYRFYSWLELWTSQGINQDQWPRTGIRTQGRAPGEDRYHYTWGNMGGREYRGGGTTGPIASAEHLLAAARMSNDGKAPSPQWDLMRRARGLPWTQGRERVIDAATAAEVAVERSLVNYLAGHDLGDEEIDAILAPFTGIAEKLRLMEKLNPPQKSLVNRVRDRVAGPRNRAAHAGWSPTPEVVDACLATAADVLSVYDPLPQPTDA